MDYESIYPKVRIKILVPMLIGLAFSMQAQKYFDNNWLFGYGTGIPDTVNPFGGIIMSFTNNKVSFTPQARDFEFSWQANSFSNSYGDLLLMSNGCSVADASSSIIKNGDSLGFGKIWGVNCPKNQPHPQAGLFVNFSNDTNIIAFLHIILDTIGNGSRAFLKCIYETKIDLTSNIVLSKNKIILYDTLYGGLTAIPSNDYMNWWIIIPRFQSNDIYILLYNKNGVEKISRQSIGIEHLPSGAGVSQCVFSPDGKKYAIYSPVNGLQIFDFDRATGMLSNFKHFSLIYPFNTAGGCVFSSNSRFIYVSNPTEVLQLDLLEQDSSKVIDTVGVFDNFFDPFPTTYLQMALGPDCRIYISTYGGNRYLHVITEPNKKGKECQLINRGLKLPTRNSFVTPNFPHYRVDEPYPCDSTISIPLNTDIENSFKFREGDLMISP
ncbi:MAG: hypothetical protein IPG12_08215 [Saprospiraceae bacterium]|nr:hypothetical protein [Saprospiraceae bacterium]